MIVRLAVVSAASLLGAAGVEAQEPNPFSPIAVFQMADRQDWLIRASLRGGEAVVGRVRDIDDVGARLEGGSVRFRDVALLERGERQGGGGKKGAVVGGAALGALTALLLFVGPTGAGSGGDFLLGISAGVGVGAIVGGLIGAAVSPSETDWVPIWPGHSVDQ
ncbi:MAG TPA: hypothetical protein VMN78_01690 [Longimicrobiales bacterium]|nr:hypothetical protein [Longimicrobiales bacterium]